ncbi:hypothetical protein Ahy_A07g032337 [Arachis hypogaea]|uniref:Transposase MuDR plant domain-containing protein n=1 Tax=Arachis hypogaea TaxID=3818 RepID=A0A445C6T4_ARAHY|nr:hypothetical protein Ahy_A07g032337 [Arachis hypogaea]
MMRRRSLYWRRRPRGLQPRWWVEFQIGHRFKCRDAVIQGVKNYSIRRSAEYRVVESDRLKYHMYCRQAATGYPWSLRVALR